MRHFLALLALLLLSSFTAPATAMDIDYLRNQYEKAIADKVLCATLIEQLEKASLTSTQLAYLGALQTIWANHTSNPWTKYKTFIKGKNNIEKAITLDASNPEIRFIRLSVQKNCPKFLGYHKNIEEDQQFIIQQLPSLVPESLKKKIKTLLNP